MKKTIMFLFVLIGLSMSGMAALGDTCSSANSLLEGETNTYRVQGSDYEVFLFLVGDSEVKDVSIAKFEVNGERTNEMTAGSSYELADGAVLRVDEIIYQAYAGGVHRAGFCINGESGKIVEERSNPLPVACNSTNSLLEGETNTYKSCGEKTENYPEVIGINKGETFYLDGTEWKYMGADKVVTTEPFLVKLKNMASGETYQVLADLEGGKSVFGLKYGSKAYHFESLSDPYQIDYRIGLISKSYTGCGPYEIGIYLIGQDATLSKEIVRFEVNGELTDRLTEGQSYILADGTVLTVSEILYQAYAGGEHWVWFCLDGSQAAEEEAAVVRPVVHSPVTLGIDLANYPGLFIKDGWFNGYFVVGWEAPPIDNLAMTDIAVNGDYEVVDATKLDIELSDPLSNNLIVIGRPEDNQVARMLTGESKASNFLKPGEGMIKLYSNNGYVQMLVTGYTPEDTRKAAKILRDYQDYKLEGTKIIVTGTRANPKVEFFMEAVTGGGSGSGGGAVPVPEPAPRPEPTPEVDVFERACQGCRSNGNCLPYGTRLVKEGTSKFCNIDGSLGEQRSLGGACQNNYECQSNQCGSGKCIDLSGQIEEAKDIFQRFWDWLKRLLGVN